LAASDLTPNPFPLGKGNKTSGPHSIKETGRGLARFPLRDNFSDPLVASQLDSQMRICPSPAFFRERGRLAHGSLFSLRPARQLREGAASATILARRSLIRRQQTWPPREARGIGSTLTYAAHPLRAAIGTGASHFLSREKTRARGRKNVVFAPGFTLLEIAVVLFLMGLMFLIAMPYIGGLTDAELKSASRQLAGRATYLFDEASAHKLVIQLVFDMNANAYFVMTADPYSPQPTFFPDNSFSGKRVVLPDSIRIRDVSVEGIGMLSRGTIATQFYPEGYVDATLIHLIDIKGRVMTIAIDPLTGQVMVAKGDLRK
jgi:type II secretory pathway pseudopilin PulG